MCSTHLLFGGCARSPSTNESTTCFREQTTTTAFLCTNAEQTTTRNRNGTVSPRLSRKALSGRTTPWRDWDTMHLYIAGSLVGGGGNFRQSKQGVKASARIAHFQITERIVRRAPECEIRYSANLFGACRAKNALTYREKIESIQNYRQRVYTGLRYRFSICLPPEQFAKRNIGTSEDLKCSFHNASQSICNVVSLKRNTA